jgi:phosphatidate cytidylyltransferase
MTSSPPAEPHARAPGAKGFDWKNLRLRLISAGVLIPIAVGCVAYGHEPYLLLVFVAVAMLASEWAKMSAPAAVSRVAALVAAAVLASLLLGYASMVRVGWLALPVGAVLATLVARIAGWGPRSTDAGFGVLYIGAPALALLWLRDDHHLAARLNGFDWTALLLVASWAADVGAFAGGSVLRGPKLWPRISPNKTWSGFLCGLVAAGLAAGALWLVHLRLHDGLSLLASAVIGLAAGLATMGGDLWESTLKRRFGVKDSGDLIPGHGGLLDRVDGLMVAALAVGAARLLAQAGLIR